MTDITLPKTLEEANVLTEVQIMDHFDQYVELMKNEVEEVKSYTHETHISNTVIAITIVGNSRSYRAIEPLLSKLVEVLTNPNRAMLRKVENTLLEATKRIGENWFNLTFKAVVDLLDRDRNELKTKALETIGNLAILIGKRNLETALNLIPINITGALEKVQTELRMEREYKLERDEIAATQQIALAQTRVAAAQERMAAALDRNTVAMTRLAEQMAASNQRRATGQTAKTTGRAGTPKTRPAA